MKFPIEEVLCIIIGYIGSALLGTLFSRITIKYDIGVNRIFRHLPEWLSMLYLLLILLCVPFFCYSFTWCFVAYGYLKKGNIIQAILAIFVNILGVFYTIIITKDMPKRRK